MSFELKILGANAASFAHNRHQSSQVLMVENQYFLIDCGEGTQIQLMLNKIKLSKIEYIFISHMHGDHYFGLMGLISTMHLRGRENDLHIFGPAALAENITMNLKHSGTGLQYRIHFHRVDPHSSQQILETDKLSVTSIPLDHGIDCTGYLIKEKPKPHRINKNKLPENILLQHIVLLQKGEDVFDENGNLLYKNEDYTLPPKRSRSYAYCSDTKYNERIIPLIESVDLLYHEATFLDEKLERAEITHHSTAKQAATIASKANAKMLVIGHYSLRYKDPIPLLEEARLIFPECQLAIEGESYEVSDL
ncbi:ribonuclease Z [Xanthovirga aplysinae]|uniref:ribonuclease Z n=1 Tax=Xanthovirga aplysinae TaxID=2529853 RepID=UPI0012BBC3D8|nr:ribonuclease Z [Xanthovirga aplysinae]MTI32380.1 ribonuclease Z [Xanthovirga aplysinae]